MKQKKKRGSASIKIGQAEVDRILDRAFRARFSVPKSEIKKMPKEKYQEMLQRTANLIGQDMMNEFSRKIPEAFVSYEDADGASIIFQIEIVPMTPKEVMSFVQQGSDDTAGRGQTPVSGEGDGHEQGGNVLPLRQGSTEEGVHLPDNPDGVPGDGSDHGV